jgi:predicted Zn-dependent protease
MKLPAVILVLLALLLASTGCETTQKRKTKTAVTSKSEGLDENSERRLWIKANEEIRRVDRSGAIYDDKELEDYVNAVARKVAGPVAAPPISVRVIKNPYLNAVAYPTGRIYIHTGILAAMDNEAQLATILGHEFTHVVNRHAAQEFTKMKKRSESKVGLASWLGSLGETLGQSSIMASVNGYSREMEMEADREGLQRAVRAGYDPREAPKLFELFEQEIETEGAAVPFAYSDHPKTEDRIKTFKALLAADYRGRQGATNAEAFRRRTAGLLLDNAVLDLKRGNFALAELAVKKYLEEKPNDSRAYFLLGEVAREIGGTEGEKKALAHYQKAASLRQDYPEPYRAMGMIAYKQKNKQEARKNLERYLALRPDAEDRDYIRQYISECK